MVLAQSLTPSCLRTFIHAFIIRSFYIVVFPTILRFCQRVYAEKRGRLMYEKVNQDLTALIDQVIRGLTHEISVDFSVLSNQCIHCASIFQDAASLQLAVGLYALSKVHQRLHDDRGKDWIDLEKKLVVLFELCKGALTKSDELAFMANMKKIIESIRQVDSHINLFVDEVIEKAKITKGASMFRHGLSVQRVADILGISSWDLMGYLGKTQILENEDLREDSKARLLYAKKIFLG